MQAVCQRFYRRESESELALCLYKKQTCGLIKSHVLKHLENHVLQLNKRGLLNGKDAKNVKQEITYLDTLGVLPLMPILRWRPGYNGGFCCRGWIG